MEGRDVATADIPGAYMQADMDEVIHVCFSGPIALLLAKVNNKLYNKYISYKKLVLYVKLLKALYGTLQAAYLFWKELVAFLTNELGFALNPHNECVTNAKTDGKQCTILWHVWTT